MGMILRIASSRIVGQGDIVGRSGYFSLNLSANSVMRGRLVYLNFSCYIVYFHHSALINFPLEEPAFIESYSNTDTQRIFIQECGCLAFGSYILGRKA